MHSLTSLIEITGGRKSSIEADGPAQRTLRLWSPSIT